MTATRAPAGALLLALLAMISSTSLTVRADSPSGPAGSGTRDARALYASGLELLAAGDAYRANDALLAAVAANPAFADAWGALARCQYELGEYERAAGFIDEAFRYGPRSPSLLSLRGFCLLGLGRLQEAQKAFDETLSRVPRDRDARFGLALLDLGTGRPGDARARLSASLAASPGDPRALLSLALIAKAEGRRDEASFYLRESLRWTSGDADAYYAAAVMYAEDGDPVEAARLARLAVEARGSHAGARSLLASLYYDRGALDEARGVLDGSLRLDRGDAQAWFLLGLVESAADRPAEARYALSSLVSMHPDDELARIALENLVMEGTPFEDSSRASLAAWRFERARDYEKAFLYAKALAEYRRGLSVDPYANVGRRRYAELLRSAGLPQSYLAELRFLEDLGKADTALADAVEIYESILRGSVSRSWDEESPPSIARDGDYRLRVFSLASGSAPYHPGGDAVAARYLRDCLALEQGLLPDRSVPRVTSLSDAHRLSREAGVDYFLLVAVAESERDVIVSAELRTARTGALALRIEAPRSGNDRLSAAVANVVGGLRDALAPRGTLLARRGPLGLVDLGRADGVKKGDAFVVVRRGGVAIASDGSGLAWSKDDVVATLVAERVDDDRFEGRLERVGFFDRVNPRDVVLAAPPEPSAAEAPGTASAGAAAAKAEPKPKEGPVPTTPAFVWSALYERVRSLY